MGFQPISLRSSILGWQTCYNTDIKPEIMIHKTELLRPELAILKTITLSVVIKIIIERYLKERY